MSYLTQSQMARDYDLIMRVAACAATEGIINRPESWADDRRVVIMASPGWAGKYASAQATRDQWDGTGTQPPPPGENEAAITDGDILAAVQAIITAEAAAVPSDEPPAE